MTSDMQGVTKVWRTPLTQNGTILDYKLEGKIMQSSMLTGNNSSGVIHEITLLDIALATEEEESHHDLRANLISGHAVTEVSWRGSK